MMSDGDMTQRPKEATKESPTGKIESRTEELKATVMDVLEVTLAIESFLMGPTPIGTSEKEDKKSPCGWLEGHFEDLRDIIIKLQLALSILRNVKGITK